MFQILHKPLFPGLSIHVKKWMTDHFLFMKFGNMLNLLSWNKLMSSFKIGQVMEAHVYLLCCVMLAWMLQECPAQKVCGIYEEGNEARLTCRREHHTFSSLSPRIEINGQFHDFGSCSSAGVCHSEEGYDAEAELHTFVNEISVFLSVLSVNRDMKRSRCYKDGQIVFNTDCSIVVYAKANELRCESPQFVDGNTVATSNCTLDKIYPKGICNVTLLEGNPDIGDRVIKSVSHEASASFQGELAVTCQLRIEVTGTKEGNYRFKVGVTPDVQDVPVTSTVTSEISLRLSATALFNPNENGHVYDYPANGQLKLDIEVTGNPEPNRVSLSVRYNETSAAAPLTSQDYSYTYSVVASSGRGILRLVVTGGFKIGTSSFYTFQASNGVVGPEPFEYRFSVAAIDEDASELRCEDPHFVDENTAATFNCTLEKISTKGKCSVLLLEGNPNIENRVIKSVSHEDSASFPGDLAVTCQLRIEVTGNEQGNYRFQVGVTPDVQDIPVTSTVTSEITLTLSATALFNPNENGHVYDYPANGQLKLDIEVTGNPEPNRVSLSVRYDETSAAVPLSSQDYSYTYSVVASSGRGILRLVVTGGFKIGISSLYTFQASNGVVGPEPFEYRFSVDAIEDEDEQFSFFAAGCAIGGLGLFFIVVSVIIVCFPRVCKARKQTNCNSYKHADGSDYSNPVYAEPNSLSSFHNHSELVNAGPPLPLRVPKTPDPVLSDSTPDNVNLCTSSVTPVENRESLTAPYLTVLGEGKVLSDSTPDNVNLCTSSVTPVENRENLTAPYLTVLGEGKEAGYAEPIDLSFSNKEAETPTDAGYRKPPRPHRAQTSGSIHAGSMMCEATPVVRNETRVVEEENAGTNLPAVDEGNGSQPRIVFYTAKDGGLEIIGVPNPQPAY